MEKQGFYSKLPLEEKKKILKQCLVAVDKEQKEVIKKANYYEQRRTTTRINTKNN